MSERTAQQQAARAFGDRHRTPPVLLLPNAWDPISAGLFVRAGFEAVATTSGGVAWALGYVDGEVAPWAEVVAATARIVRTVAVPVTADIEAGYGATPAEVGAHVAEIVRAGVLGINLEDSTRGVMRSIDDAAARLRAARDAANREGVPIVLNARCDVFHVKQHDGAPFAATLERCKAYVAAGADCVYPFGLRDPAIIAEFVQAVGVPVNITGRPGMPDAAALQRMGVARITIASAATLAAMESIHSLAKALHATGDFNVLASPFHRPDAQSLFHGKG